MNANIDEFPMRRASYAVSTFTDEIEGELEKISVFGVHLTRKIVLMFFGLFSVTCIVIGVSLGVDFENSASSYDINQGAFGKDHRYWLLGEVIESSVGKAIYDNTTHEHEALAWLADSDPKRLDEIAPLEELLQRFVLANFYFSTHGDMWTDQYNFFSKKSVCDWNDKTSGVFCNDNDQVSEILMSESNLNGTIPHDIGLLSHMEILNLSRNEIMGTIPVSLGIMSSLTSIDMSNCGFSGAIPQSFAMLLDLVFLDLSFNSLEGEDDIDALKDLENLEELHLSRNNLEGNVGAFGDSGSLRVVDISYNNIGGTMADSFADGKMLKILKLNNNQIRGQIPAGIGKLWNLVEFDISVNHLTGSLPSEVQDMVTLQTLKLNSNELQYGLPSEVGYLNDLTVLDISDNGIESVPKELFHLKNLQALSLSSNRILGSLPTEIGLATSLVALDLSGNFFSDELPAEVGFLRALEYLYLHNNLFDGTIPVDLSNLYLLREMDLSNNNFFGDMESQFCGDRPDVGNPIEKYKADCLTGDIVFPCATECCDAEDDCCPVGDTECENAYAN